MKIRNVVFATNRNKISWSWKWQKKWIKQQQQNQLNINKYLGGQNKTYKNVESKLEMII